MSSPTQRTLKKWRDAGYTAAVVEKWNSHARCRQDLYGIIDVLCVGHGETVGVQSTSGSNVSTRIRKIEDSEVLAELRKSGWRVIVEGWRKKPNGRYECREVDIS